MTTAADKTLVQQIINLGEKHQLEKLQKLVESTSIKTLKNLLHAKLGRSDCITFWNYVLQGFGTSFEAKDKRFAFVKSFLDGLLKVELSYKQTYDLITRLCQDLPSFPNDQLIEIVEHQLDALRLGDPKCVGWKDLLPEVLQVLTGQTQLSVNGVNMSGVEYHDTILRNLCTMRWPTTVLTPIADMLKEFQLSAGEMVTVLNKFAKDLHALEPTELPALAYQLFSMCATAPQIIIPILAFEKYFHHYYYKKLFADMNSNTSDFDSIDRYSDKELCEAEETILHHLNYCTQFKISEIQLFLVLKNFTSMPDVMLTPFMVSAILSMTVANREPESRLNSSPVLALLRTAIKHNEMEHELADYSVWCRDCMHRKQVDLDQLFTVLIDRNKEGKEVITTGLVKLAFVLLRAKGSTVLNTIAISFLTKFIRKRHVFGKGIIKKVCDWMIIEQDQMQYSECLTLLSIADTLTVSECIKTINYVMDFFLWIPGDQSMRMMSFILPTLKISAIVRDAFIDVLRRAISTCEMKTRRMAVYGFCMILKQLNNSNSQRTLMGSGGSGSMAGLCTQQSISGYALMSQSTLGSRSNPQRHFDMLTLEIIGVLRNCFTQPIEMKTTLYENLQRAVELNPKLVPHILQFIDWHFRSYFQSPTVSGDDDDDAADVLEVQQFAVKFDLLVRALDDHERELEVYDNLGQLILCVSHCLIIFEKLGTTDYDTSEMKRLLDMAVEKFANKELEFEHMIGGQLTHYKLEMCAQQMNFIEGLMAYVLLTAKTSNDNVKQLLPLYRVHRKVQEYLKSMSSSVRKAPGKKTKADSSHNADTSGGNVTINGVVIKTRPQLSQLTNVWDMPVLERFLHLLHDDIVPFAQSEHTGNLRSSVELVNYVLRVTTQKISSLRDEPEYKQLAHSRRMLKYLTDVTKIIYERCMKRLPELWRNFDVSTAALAADCFYECLQSAHTLYRKKFTDVFVKGFDFAILNRCKEAPIVLQEHISAYMMEATSGEAAEELSKRKEGNRIPLALLESLELLYDNIAYDNRVTTESYTWLLTFCKTHTLTTGELGLVHKLLFRQRQKTHSGAFYNTIAAHLRLVLGAVNDGQLENALADVGGADGETELPFKLKSITLDSAETCLKYLYEALGKQLEDVEYFITKSQNLHYKSTITPIAEQDQCLSVLRTLERSICSQLIHISQTLLQLSNVALPLGASMDGLLRLLMQHYVCLKNLTKHFLSASSRRKLCTQGAKFDLLLHTMGKSLPSNIYALISYIEGNILRSDDGADGQEAGPSKKLNPKAEKAKVLRETKLIPKLILCVENFNKHVIMLSKKTNDRLANLLHFGTVRDFRIKTSELKAAIDRTFSHSSQIVVDPSVEGDGAIADGDGIDDDDEDEEETLLARMEQESAANKENDSDVDNGQDKDDSEDKEDEEEEDNDDNDSGGRKSTATTSSSSVKSAGAATRSGKSKTVAKRRQSKCKGRTGDDKNVNITPTTSGELQNESNKESHTQLLKNLDAINKKAKKRTLYDAEQNEPDARPANVLTAVPTIKRRRAINTRSAKK